MVLRLTIVLLSTLFIVGCSTVSKTRDLQPGMSTAQVKEIMGEPKEGAIPARLLGMEVLATGRYDRRALLPDL